MDRRKTLAGLSPAQLNARHSLAPRPGGKPAAGKLPLDKALSRMSLAGPVARRSSAYTTKVSGLKSDPRPIGDKGFQAACIRTVIAYLAAHGFEYAITPKARGRLPVGCQPWEGSARGCAAGARRGTLRCRRRRRRRRHVSACPHPSLQVLASPTTRDFTNVMQFVFRQFDAVQPKTWKLEEEVGAGGRHGLRRRPLPPRSSPAHSVAPSLVAALLPLLPRTHRGPPPLHRTVQPARTSERCRCRSCTSASSTPSRSQSPT